jgi:WD40 repeat protein
VTENNQPKPDDAVLGGQSPVPPDALVLGGIEGLKLRLASTNGKQKIAVLKEALKYGQKGLELLIHALQDKEWQVSCASYALLQENVEPELKQALQKYDPYLMYFHSFNAPLNYVNVKCIAFSPDGSTLASGCSYNRIKTIKLWDIKRGTLKSTLTGHSDDVYSIAFSPDGSTLASCSYDKTIKLWDINGELKNTLTEHSAYVHSIAFSPNGSTLASCSYDKTIKLWDINGELKNTLFGHTAYINSIAFSPDGITLASYSNDRSIKLWDIKRGALKNTLTGHLITVNSIAFSPDGSTLASCSSDKTIKLWDIKRGALKNTFTGHSDSVRAIAFSPDGSTLASCSSDSTIKLWDIKSGTLKNTLTGHSGYVYSITFSPDGSTLASCSSDSTIKLWDINRNELKNNLIEDLSPTYFIAFSPDGSTLASCSEGYLKLWVSVNLNLSKQEPVKLFRCYIALKEVLKSDKAGLNQVIDALDSESWEVHEAAYSLLLTREERRSKKALQNYTRSKLNSEANVDYTRLQHLLARQRWKDAEVETKSIMLEISAQKRGTNLNPLLSTYKCWDDFNVQTKLNCIIPNPDLYIIYDLWQKYRNAYSNSFSQSSFFFNFWIMTKTKLEPRDLNWLSCTSALPANIFLSLLTDPLILAEL